MPKRERKNQPGISLYDLTPTELESFFLSIGEEQYRARQVLDFLYRHPVDRFEEMTSLSKPLRERLSETVRLAPIDLRTTVETSDGTVKHAYEVRDRARNRILLESVWMPADGTDVGETDYVKGKSVGNRRTLCISSQLGCAAGCSFCATGRVGLKGQLTTGEIVYQVVHAWKTYGALPDTVLFMGMGEPMHNYEAVESAIEILTSEKGMGFSPRRIVVSSCGEIEKLRSFRSKHPKVGLAISLNAASDELRTHLMPVNKTYNLNRLLSFIDQAGASGRDKITLEYVVLAGVNDTPEQVKKLTEMLRPVGRKVKVNLIPFNPVDGIEYRTPAMQKVFDIQENLIGCGISTFIRKNRGKGVSAACGQLSGR